MLPFRSLIRVGLRQSPLNRSHASRQIIRGVKTPTIDWKPLRSSVNNLAKAEMQAKSPIFRRVLFGLMVAMPVISFFLGVWQVKRLRWKTNLIKRSEHMLAEPPMEGLPANIDPDMVHQFEFRRFRIKGHFDYANEMFLGPRIRNLEQGYLVVTPFVRADGGEPILIERGWIHKSMVLPERRARGYLAHLALPQGEIYIEAMLRCMPKRSTLQYEHEENSRVFYVPDVAAMAEQSGALPVYAQMMYSLKDQPSWRGPLEPPAKPSVWNIILKAKPAAEHLPDSEDDVTLQYQEFEFVREGVPLAAIPKVSFTNNHFQYLITWFGVSLASTALLFYMFYKKKQYGSAEQLIEAKRRDMRKRM